MDSHYEAVLFTASEQLGRAEAFDSNFSSQLGFGIFSARSSDFADDMGIYGVAGNTDSTHSFIIENVDGAPPNSPVDPENTTYDLLRGQNSSLGGYWSDVSPFDEATIHGLNWGLWLTAGEGGEGNENPLLLKNAGGGASGNSNYLAEDDSAFVWFSVGGTTSSYYLNEYTGHKRFQADHTNVPFQMRSSNDNWTVFEFSADLEIHLDYAEIDGSLHIDVCDTNCSTGLEQEWNASFFVGEGGAYFDLNGTGFSLDLVASEVTVQNEGDMYPTNVTGLFQGYYAGEEGNSFSAGFNFGGSGTDAPGEDFVSGLILFDALDKLNAIDLLEVTDQESGDAAFAFAISNSEFFGSAFDEKLIWGWTDADENEDSPLLLTRDDSGTSTLAAGADIYDSGEGAFDFDKAILYFDDNSAHYDTEIADGSAGDGFQMLWGLWTSDDDPLEVYDEASILNGMSGYDTEASTCLLPVYLRMNQVH